MFKEVQYTVDDVRELRNKTKIGDRVKFRVERFKGYAMTTDPNTGIVSSIVNVDGIVDSKFKHIFMLEDGRTYSWVEYLLGRQTL